MTDNNMERISYLEKRVAELQEELAKAKSPGIFFKVLLTLILAGSCFLIWKCRIFFKWAILALLAYWIFGGFVCDICSATSNFISTSWNEWKQKSKIEDEHERNMERIRTESDVLNSKVKAESDARVNETRANSDAKTNEITAEADAKVKLMNTEESIERAKWERGQAEKRNDAINDAIRGGTWNSKVEETPIETKNPVPINETPNKPAETLDESPIGPNVKVVTNKNLKPKIIRTQEGNITRVTVRF